MPWSRSGTVDVKPCVLTSVSWQRWFVSCGLHSVDFGAKWLTGRGGGARGEDKKAPQSIWTWWKSEKLCHSRGKKSLPSGQYWNIFQTVVSLLIREVCGSVKGNGFNPLKYSDWHVHICTLQWTIFIFSENTAGLPLKKGAFFALRMQCVCFLWRRKWNFKYFLHDLCDSKCL